MGAESPEHSARTARVFNPVARVLNVDEGNDTAYEDEQLVVAPDVPELQQPESPVYALHMPELRQPESSVRGIWLCWPRPDNGQDESEEDRLARIEEKRLEELIWQDIVIVDKLFQDEVPLVADQSVDFLRVNLSMCCQKTPVQRQIQRALIEKISCLVGSLAHARRERWCHGACEAGWTSQLAAHRRKQGRYSSFLRRRVQRG